MASLTLKSIPLTDLKVSRLNMRHGRKAPDIDDILPSVRAISGQRPGRERARGFEINP